MLLRIRQWLDPLPDECQGIDVVAIREDLSRLHRRLEEVGPEGIDAMGAEFLNPIQGQFTI